MFIGRLNDFVQIQIRESECKVRIEMYVDEKDNARLEFLDSEGEVMMSF